MTKIVRMTEFRMKSLIYLAQAYDVSITFSGSDCSVVTITNHNGTSYEMESSFCYDNWHVYRRRVMQVMSTLHGVEDL